MRTPVIAVCHLGWDWVWQRPQQFLSRLSRLRPVLFVETHATEGDITLTRLRRAPGHSGVALFQIHLPARRWNDVAFCDSERRRVMQHLLASDSGRMFSGGILWISDPMAVTAFVGQLGESLLIYDCMDELSQFRGAHPLLGERDQFLTARADLIFCGGRRMRDRRIAANPETYFFGTGVDFHHFGRALSPATAVHPAIAAISPPVLGYFGVIDERMDYDLITALADSNPRWSVAMVGPFAKIDPNGVPRRPNLHWIGERPYADLPAIAKGFAVALMPFARNAATEFINPTKTLEYMAAGRPVVSTALDEVKANYGGVPLIAGTHAEFIALCQEAIISPGSRRIQEGLALAAANSWEHILAGMETRITAIQDRRRAELLAPSRI